MIDIVNKKTLTVEQRKASINRAIHSQSFYNLLEFKPVTAAKITSNFAAKIQVNKDYWVTSVQGNFAEANVDVKAFYNMSIYISGTGDSLFRYIADELLPSGFLATQANQFSAAGSRFDDRQREIMPRLIKAGNEITGQIAKKVALVESSDIEVVLGGYYTFPTAYIPDRALKGINESLSDDIRFDEWKFSVTEQGGNITKILQNDRFARMVLGFGIVNKPLGGLLVSQGTFVITDTFRNIKLNNVPINIAFFAPKQYQQSQDQNITWLPVEHFWEPFAPLKFEITNDVGIAAGAGYDLIMLTRTV